MKYFLLIFVLLLKDQTFLYDEVTISNANPIQFWLIGEQSFNEKQVCGINTVCYCQPFNTDDPLVFQIYETDNSKSYYLKVLGLHGVPQVSPILFIKTTHTDYQRHELHNSLVSLGVDAQPIQFVINDGTNDVAFSDCIDFQTSHDCTELIEYSNASDYAGLIFSDSSPSTNFYLRIPAIFYEEEFPTEQEDLELSNDTIVTLYNKVEKKRLLEIGDMPFYMHEKLNFVLQMETIIIDSTYWRRRDPYQIKQPSSRRYALRQASVQLSDQDFIDRNLL